MLRRRDADLDSADTFLPLVLGSLSLARRVERYLDSVPVAPEAAGPSRAPSSPDDPTTLLILGILALGRRLRAEIEGAATSEPDSAPLRRAADVSPDPHRSSLLR